MFAVDAQAVLGVVSVENFLVVGREVRIVADVTNPHDAAHHEVLGCTQNVGMPEVVYPVTHRDSLVLEARTQRDVAAVFLVDFCYFGGAVAVLILQELKGSRHRNLL